MSIYNIHSCQKLNYNTPSCLPAELHSAVCVVVVPLVASGFPDPSSKTNKTHQRLSACETGNTRCLKCESLQPTTGPSACSQFSAQRINVDRHRDAHTLIHGQTPRCTLTHATGHMILLDDNNNVHIKSKAKSMSTCGNVFVSRHINYYTFMTRRKVLRNVCFLLPQKEKVRVRPYL